MFKKIEQLTFLKFEIKVGATDYGANFLISISRENKTESVILPYHHLTESKIVDYLNLLFEKFPN